MGGLFSGYPSWRDRKTITAHCVRLSITALSDDQLRINESQPPSNSGFSWKRSEYSAKAPRERVLQIHYVILTASGFRRTAQTMTLQSTEPHYGGLRWWFTCPMINQGFRCDRRVGKLYLPPDARYFGCRSCYDLTYRSVQEHDHRITLLRQNPAALSEAGESLNTLSDFARFRLACKAAGRREQVQDAVRETIREHRLKENAFIESGDDEENDPNELRKLFRKVLQMQSGQPS